jgi:hypothetical protein
MRVVFFPLALSHSYGAVGHSKFKKNERRHFQCHVYTAPLAVTRYYLYS